MKWCMLLYFDVNMLSHMFRHLRLAVLLCLSGSPLGALAVLGVECSTFVPVNKGTSKRDELNPWGNVLAASVAAASRSTSRQAVLERLQVVYMQSAFKLDVACRCMLLLVLLVCMGHNFFVENPANTILGLYPRFQWVFKVLKSLGIPASWQQHV